MNCNLGNKLAVNRWIQNNLQACQVAPTTRALREEDLIIFHRIVNDCIQPRRCFANAALLTQKIPSCKYVLGIIKTNQGLVSHAWNRLGRNHFDITAEKFIESCKISDYFCVSELNYAQLLQLPTCFEAPLLVDVFHLENIRANQTHL